MFYFLIQDRFRNEAANEMTGAVGLRRVPKQFIENNVNYNNSIVIIIL
jgi:type I restriction enzyme S subunit